MLTDRTNPYICFQTSVSSHDPARSKRIFTTMSFADAENVMALLGKVKEKFTEVISENSKH